MRSELHMAIQKRIVKTSVFLIILLHFFSTVHPVSAQTAEEKNFLLMYFKEEELVVESPTRNPKPVSETAENITVVTASDIALMNAHTLADVLNTVTGVQIFMTGGPGTTAVSYIQGSDNTHVTVMIDGIVLNTLADNISDVGMLPVQMIQKIEIIQGPASSAWGSALGGVVNVITKSGGLFNQGNKASLSMGERKSDDFRVETMGKQDNLGYYLAAGRLQSDGVTPHLGLSNNNAYGKLTYDLTGNTNVLFSAGLVNVKRNTAEIDEFDVSYKTITELAYSTLAVNSSLNKDVSLNIALRTMHNRAIYKTYQLSSGDMVDYQKYKDAGYGASAKLAWINACNSVVAGLDYNDDALESNTFLGDRQTLRTSAIYINDTIVLGNLSLTPGIRYDNTSTNGDATSPSLGIAYGISKSTLLRIYAGEGFNIPPLNYTYGNTSTFTANPDLKPEKVRSYQAGAETASRYLWLKASVFRNDVRSAVFLQEDPTTSFIHAINQARQRRQGFEIEMKTAPLYNTALIAGAEFVKAKDLDTDQTLPGVPTRVYDLGLQYDDRSSLKALLKGRYIDWNADPSPVPFESKDRNFVFDLNVVKKIYEHRDSSLNAFLTVHNIFNQEQYLVQIYQNPKQWIEGGVGYTF